MTPKIPHQKSRAQIGTNTSHKRRSNRHMQHRPRLRLQQRRHFQNRGEPNHRRRQHERKSARLFIAQPSHQSSGDRHAGPRNPRHQRKRLCRPDRCPLDQRQLFRFLRRWSGASSDGSLSSSATAWPARSACLLLAQITARHTRFDQQFLPLAGRCFTTSAKIIPNPLRISTAATIHVLEGSSNNSRSFFSNTSPTAPTTIVPTIKSHANLLGSS